MEPFEINLVGEILTVMPNPDGSFTILSKNKLLGTITPSPEESTFVKWISLDLMSVDLAQQIGELIEEHEM